MTDPFDDLRRYADDLRSEVSPFTAERAVHSALRPRVARHRRAVMAVVTTGLLGVSNVALAATADPAVPGDVLYGVDRAYERVADFAGLGGPRVSERLQEAGVLVDRGRLADALALVQETLGKILESDDPKEGLEELVAGTDELRGAVDEIVLEELVATAKAVGSSDLTGQDVAELARQLGRQLSEERSQRPDDAGPPNTGPPDESPSVTAPGRTNPATTNPNAGGNRP